MASRPSLPAVGEAFWAWQMKWLISVGVISVGPLPARVGTGRTQLGIEKRNQGWKIKRISFI